METSCPRALVGCLVACELTGLAARTLSVTFTCCPRTSALQASAFSAEPWLLAVASGSCGGPRVWAGAAQSPGEPRLPAPAMPVSLSNCRRRQHYTGRESEAGSRFRASWGFRGVPFARQLSALSPRSASQGAGRGSAAQGPGGRCLAGGRSAGQRRAVCASQTALPGARARGVGSGARLAF